MRWQFLGLLLIGVVAAVCAALLVASLKTSPVLSPSLEPAKPSAPPTVKIVVANKAITPMTKVDESMVSEVEVPAASAAEGAYPSKSMVINQILVTPMAPNQAFTKNSFAATGPGVHLATTLPDGMRAMSVSLSDYSSLDGLLYPGSAVDVVASFDLRGKADDKEAGVISTTILRSVQVLAIEDKTAVSSSEKTDETKVNRQGNRRRVTLMVTPRQAEELQLAMEHGVISLALRNPGDKTMANSADREIVNLRDFGGSPVEPVIVEKPVYIDRPVPAQPAMAEVEPAPKPEVTKIPKWMVTVYKGSDKSEVSGLVKQKK